MPQQPCINSSQPEFAGGADYIRQNYTVCSNTAAAVRIDAAPHQNLWMRTVIALLVTLKVSILQNVWLENPTFQVGQSGVSSSASSLYTHGLCNRYLNRLITAVTTIHKTY
jgi:hypothetical protein